MTSVMSLTKFPSVSSPSSDISVTSLLLPGLLAVATALLSILKVAADAGVII